MNTGMHGSTMGGAAEKPGSLKGKLSSLEVSYKNILTTPSLGIGSNNADF